jgi:hypothetical protein
VFYIHGKCKNVFKSPTEMSYRFKYGRNLVIIHSEILLKDGIPAKTKKMVFRNDLRA